MKLKEIKIDPKLLMLGQELRIQVNNDNIGKNSMLKELKAY